MISGNERARGRLGRWGAAVLAGAAALAMGAMACGRTEDTVKVGYYGSMTGKEATFGQSTYNGIKLAVDEINAKGGLNGKKIDVIQYDDKGDSTEAGTAVTRLIESDHVVAVLGEVASSLSLGAGT